MQKNVFCLNFKNFSRMGSSPAHSTNRLHSILDELLNPIVNDPESLADLCLWIENLSEQNGASDQNHSYFLDSVKWHAISAICKIRSRKAYDEFMRIRKTIGSDGAESMFFKELKEKYFGDRD